MKILALEFSSEQRSAAIAARESDECKILSSVFETGGRSTRAVSLIERALAEALLEREAIDCIAVGIGPGSYTGIRAGIALTQGWQLATGIKVLAISSVEALTLRAQLQNLHGTVTIVVDAQKNEFYLATYEISAERIVEMVPLHLTSRAAVEELATAGGFLIGPDAGGFANGRPVFPSADAVARIACRRSDFIPASDVQPIYLREANFVKAPAPRIIP